jgi:hypothetical protein
LSSSPAVGAATAANWAPRSRAIDARACASLPPTTASTAKRSGCRRTTSATERPTEPVAPRMVTRSRMRFTTARRGRGRRGPSRRARTRPRTRRAGP